MPEPVSDIRYTPSESARVRARVWRRWCGSWWCGAALVLLGLAVYLPGLSAIPPVDRDESRFAQASRQMFESGDYVLPRVQDRPRLNKPPLIYWLHCGSIALFGDEEGRHANANIWVFRLSSVLCAIGAGLLTWRIGLRVFDPRAAALGAALLAVCPMVAWDAHQARADQLLLLTTTGAMWAMLRAWRLARDNGAVTACAFWTFVALGVLAKGPVTPLVAGLTALALGVSTGRWGWVRGLRPVLGVGLLALIVAPWVVAVGDRVGWAEYARIVFSETIGRSASPKENHWFPPGFHLVVFSVLFWPGSLVTGLAVAWAARRAFPAARDRDGPGRLSRIRARLTVVRGDMGLRFLLCWVVPSWIFFELISTKLPHYVMPLYPALALISARGVFAAEGGRLPGVRSPGARAGFAVWVGVGAAAMLGLTGVVLYAGRVDESRAWWSLSDGLWLPGSVIVVGLIAAARALQRSQFMRAQAWGVAMVVLWGATFLGRVLPSAERFWISTRIAAAGGPGASLVNASKFREDSLIFVHRGRVRVLDEHEAVADIKAGGSPGRVYLFSAGTLVDLADQWRTVEVEGWNYSVGKRAGVRVVVPAAGE
ncbi:MAG: ArnT family glycosyltransferase [Phycisphaerales bacterium]